MKKLLLAFAVWGCVVQAHAFCSICFSHAFGAALQGLGAQTLMKGQTLVGVGYLRFEKSNAGEEPGTSESETHQETLLSVMYGVTDRVTVAASLPYIDNEIRESGEGSERGRGLGDLTLSASYQLPAKVSDRYLTSLMLAVKLPTGENDARDENGELKEQHLQVGTGSTDITAGLGFTWEGSGHKGLWFANVNGRLTGSNSRGFRFGNALFYGLGYSLPLRNDSAIVLETGGKLVAKDRREDGSDDPNSGGHVHYLTGSYRHNLGRDFGLIVSYQHPIYQRLNGTQDEKGILSVSVTKLF